MNARKPPTSDEELKEQIVDTIERLKLLVNRLEATIDAEDGTHD